MIYDQIRVKLAPTLKLLDEELTEIVKSIATLTEAIKVEDSKKHEAELREARKVLERQRREIWHKQQALEVEEFKRLIAEEYDLPQTHPKFAKAYSIAYQHGSGCGWSDVESLFGELVELVKG